MRSGYWRPLILVCGLIVVGTLLVDVHSTARGAERPAHNGGHGPGGGAVLCTGPGEYGARRIQR